MWYCSCFLFGVSEGVWRWNNWFNRGGSVQLKAAYAIDNLRNQVKVDENPPSVARPPHWPRLATYVLDFSYQFLVTPSRLVLTLSPLHWSAPRVSVSLLEALTDVLSMWSNITRVVRVREISTAIEFSTSSIEAGQHLWFRRQEATFEIYTHNSLTPVGWAERATIANLLYILPSILRRRTYRHSLEAGIADSNLPWIFWGWVSVMLSIER